MPRRRVSLVVSISMVVCVTLGMTALGGSARAARPFSSGGGAPSGKPRSLLAAVPYMGWNTYYGVGGIFDEQTIISVAKSLLQRGLARAGYRIVWLDFGWASGKRDGRGELVVDRHQWPHGLRWLTDWLHRHGLLAGIYTDAGKSGCHGQGVGSLGHYQQDADRFAAWGFDAVKVDFCGAGQAGLVPKPAYARFAKAIANNSSHRKMILNVCNFWVPGQINGTLPTYANSAYASYRWASRIAQSWRTDTDIGFTRNIQFVNVLRNLDHDAAHPTAAGPGHWNDPDYLGPELGMTPAEAQAQFSMWAIVAAPLILGSDPRALSTADDQDAREPPGDRGRPGSARDPGHGRATGGIRAGVEQAAERRAGRGRAAQPRRGAVADHHHREQGRATVGRALHAARSVGRDHRRGRPVRSAPRSRPTASSCTG